MAYLPADFTGTYWRILDGDIYVSSLGDDTSGNGSPTHPYKSFQKAINVAVPSNRIIVGTGYYSGSISGLDKNDFADCFLVQPLGQRIDRNYRNIACGRFLIPFLDFGMNKLFLRPEKLALAENQQFFSGRIFFFEIFFVEVKPDNQSHPGFIRDNHFANPSARAAQGPDTDAHH